MAGFSVADFFVKLSIDADTKEVAKIEKALKKVNKSLQAIGANSVAQANKMDKAFSGDILKKKQLQIRAAHDALNRMGVSLVDFKQRLSNTTKDSEFIKISNEIKEATLNARKLKGETNSLYKSKKMVGDLSLNGRDPTSPFGATAKQTHLNAFTQADKYLDEDVQGRKLTMFKTDEQVEELRAEAREFEKLKVATDTAHASLKKLSEQQDSATAASEKAEQQLKKQNQIMRRMKSSAMQLAQSFVGAFAIFNSVRSINRVGQDFEGMRAAMIASSGSSKAAADDLAFIDKQAVRLGLDLKSTTDAYAKLQFSAKGKMSKEDTRGLFVGFSEFSTALKVSPEQQKSGLRALQQMLNKTTIMSEELKGQLAEQIPGSIQIFAKAAGVDEPELFKMMEAGTLKSAEILPKVAKLYAEAAREGGALGEALKSVRVQQGRFNTELQKSGFTVFTSGFGAGFSSILSSLTENMKDLKGLASGLGIAFKMLFKAIAVVIELIAIPLKVISITISKIKELFGEIGVGLALIIATTPLLIKWGAALKAAIGYLSALRIGALALAPAFTAGFWPITLALFALKEVIALLSDDVIGDIEVMAGKDFSLSNLTGKKIGSKSPEIKIPEVARSMSSPSYFGGHYLSNSIKPKETKNETNFNAPITVVANNPEEFRSKIGDIATAQAQR